MTGPFRVDETDSGILDAAWIVDGRDEMVCEVYGSSEEFASSRAREICDRLNREEATRMREAVAAEMLAAARAKREALAIEMVASARKQGLRITEVAR